MQLALLTCCERSISSALVCMKTAIHARALYLQILFAEVVIRCVVAAA
jgi:hypothetical protein